MHYVLFNRIQLASESGLGTKLIDDAVWKCPDYQLHSSSNVGLGTIFAWIGVPSMRTAYIVERGLTFS